MFETKPPGCIEVEDPTGHRRIACGRRTLQQKIGEPILPTQAGVEVSRTERSAQRIPPARHQQPSAGKPCHDVCTKVAFIEIGYQNQPCVRIIVQPRKGRTDF
jgi:hypothetical protein